MLIIMTQTGCCALQGGEKTSDDGSLPIEQTSAQRLHQEMAMQPHAKPEDPETQ